MLCPLASCLITATVNTGEGDGGALIGTLCLGGFFHLSIEAGQLLIASRVSDINDVLSGLP